MRPIEWHTEHADELGQEVVDAWTDRSNADSAGNVADDFQLLFEMASQYRIAKATADRRRQFADLKKTDEVEGKAAREAFAKAYKNYSESKERGALA
jgi:hypothetical protein